MENKAHALVAGIFTITLLIGAVLLGLWLNRDRVEWVPYQIATKLSIPGLNPQAAVRYRGLDVGKVDDITFDPREVGQILVHISVRPDTPITQSTFATLAYQGVTGIGYVQLDDDGSRPVKLHSDKERIARIEMHPSLFDRLQDSGQAILQQAEEVTRRINAMLQPENQKAILAAFDNVSKAAQQLETIPRQLQPALARLPQLTEQAQQTLGAISSLSQDAGVLVGSLNGIATELQAPQGPLAKVADSAERLGAAASRLEREAAPLANDARASMRALNRTLNQVNAHPQSILFGPPAAAPGPGEPGFIAPAP